MPKIVIEFLASFLIWLMFAGLVVLWFIDGKIKKEQVIHALIASFTAWLFAEVLKELFHTQRPFVVNHEPTLTYTLISAKDSAFPSGHSALAFGLATTLWLHDRKVGWFFLISALLVGWARVAANVHYPVDILGGAVLGIFTAMVVERIHFFQLLTKAKKLVRK